MSGWTEGERLGMWLAENPHRIFEAARCPGRDGRVIAKICDVEGLQWVWTPGNRMTRAEWMEELEELLDLPTTDNRGDGDVRALIDGHPPTGGVEWPARAFPADGVQQILTTCPACRLRYKVVWVPETRTFDVKREER